MKLRYDLTLYLLTAMILEEATRRKKGRARKAKASFAWD